MTMSDLELARIVGAAIGDGPDRLVEGDYRHVGSGKRYAFVGVGLEEATLTPVVAYRSLDTGLLWTRPADEFRKRFVRVES